PIVRSPRYFAGLAGLSIGRGNPPISWKIGVSSLSCAPRGSTRAAPADPRRSGERRVATVAAPRGRGAAAARGRGGGPGRSAAGLRRAVVPRAWTPHAVPAFVRAP